MKVEIISKETIKPSSPTPANQRNFKLSLLDQLIPAVHSCSIYFYSSNYNVSSSEVSQNLKKSMSETLTLYYPLAGKTVDNMRIDCNDNGALYVEAQVDIPMSCFLQQPDGHDLQQFLPTKIEHSEEDTGFFTLIQASFFSCGGLAISMCFSHKLVDAVTSGTFVRTWAKKMTGNYSIHKPVYQAGDLFPAREILSNREHRAQDFQEQRLPFKRLVFDSSKIASLKACFGEEEYIPSRSELITAVIWKSALKAARSRSRSSRLHSVMCRAVNLRRKISPSITENSVGNFLGIHNAIKDGSEVDIGGLIHEMRKGLKNFDEKFVSNLQTGEGLEAVIQYFNESAREMIGDNVEAYICTSLCNMSLYDVDFGWGTPVWMTFPIANKKNLIMLNDSNKGDGSVEAWVVLSDEDMYFFERDPELLAYTSLNPPVL